ncbi:MAG: sodium:solute symporter [Cyclobacteriaceae bacterium]
MSPSLILTVLGSYFVVLYAISYYTSRKADSNTFFTGDRQSPWFLVAYGMIGASLSGVTFISVPGEVGNTNLSYFQVVLGYLLGYLVIATVLMPLYYRLNLVSIYTYLQGRFGFWSYKSGALFFLLSRTIQASFRLFLVAGVLQLVFFEPLGVPFWGSVFVTIGLIWLYTFKGGIKTVVWTDTLQTTFMIVAVVVTISVISSDLSLGLGDLAAIVTNSELSQIFVWDWQPGTNFFKQFFSGAFIAIVMTGLDQDMMQKNLTCKNIGDAQKNMFWFSVILVIVNLMFLTLGILLYHYAEVSGIQIPERSDDLFPFLAVNHFTLVVGITFLLGIVAAAYSSADSALTALTTSFCIDFLGFNKVGSSAKTSTRTLVHLGFSFLLFIIILIFNAINDRSVITAIFIAAGYTYGPILGLFSFGILTKWNIKDQWALPVCILSPIVAYFININSDWLLGGYKFGFEILILNGLLTFIGLLIIRKRE